MWTLELEKSPNKKTIRLNNRAARKARAVATNDDLTDRDNIFRLHLERCQRLNLTQGDKVQFKKPKKNPLKGTIVDVETDVARVKWENNTPLLITVAYMAKGDVYEVGTTSNRIRKIYA